jgi:3-oxoacyl-[acyl-carrier protein] reductase
MDLGLNGKVAMVGGASRGLGLAVARVLLREGAQVSMASSQKRAICDAAHALANEVGGGSDAAVLPVEADLRSGEAILRWRDATVRRFGGVDLLFVNTGGPPPGTALSFDDAGWQHAFELLLLSTVRMIRATVPSMTERGGGSIVVSTSSSVKEPIQNLALSNVMRASVAALAKTLSNELAPQRIRVNHLLPGRIDTDRVRHLDTVRGQQAGISMEEQRDRFAKTIPLGRYGVPEEFAKAAAFLLSEASAYTTGASLQVDGGLIRGVL